MRPRVVFASSSSAPPPRPRRPPIPPPAEVKPLSSAAPVPQEKEQKEKHLEPRRRDALLGTAFSALAGSLAAGDRASFAAGDRASFAATATTPVSPPPPPAGWSYASKGKDWTSLGFDSCAASGQQSPINISPPFTRIIGRGSGGGGGGGASRGEQQEQQQQPFLELSADYSSACFDAVVERGVTASPKFTVVAAEKKRGARDQQQQQEQRHPAGGIYLTNGETENEERVFYPLVQFHFHRPGEEALEGKRGVLGAHLVHQRDGNSSSDPSSLLLPRFVVVAVAFDLSSRKKPDAALADLFGGGEEGDEEFEEGPPWRRVEAFDPSRLLPESSLSAAAAPPPSSSSSSRRLTNFFAFEGSLTTPPCTKGARFYFVKGRKAATPEQVSRAVLPRGTAQNARPLQDRGGRVVWEG